VRQQWTLFSPSESYAGFSKRPRTLGYNIEDAKRDCHGYISAVATESQSNLNFSVSPVSSSENAGYSKGPSTVGSDENLHKNISAVATESEVCLSCIIFGEKQFQLRGEAAGVVSVISVSNWTLNGPSEHCSTSKEEAKTGKNSVGWRNVLPYDPS
jgi:hypothetical protein